MFGWIKWLFFSGGLGGAPPVVIVPPIIEIGIDLVTVSDLGIDFITMVTVSPDFNTVSDIILNIG